MEDPSGHKRPRSQPQKVPAAVLQKRHNTRSTRPSATCCNGIPTPIRIHPATHSLYFRRMHELFFSKGNEAEDAATTGTTDTPWKVRFGNVRLQSIYKSPNIYIIDQFLSVSDVQHLFTHFIAKFKFQRSFVDEGSDDEKGNHNDEADPKDDRNMTSQQQKKSSHRTSAFLALNKQHDSRIASIEHKVASLFGCSTKQIEALQLVRYQSPDQYFHVHHDLGAYDETTGNVELPNKSIWYQRRMITLFCYLNTVPPSNGGATYFPCCTKQNVLKCQLTGKMTSIKRTTSIIGVENTESDNQHIPLIYKDSATQSTCGCVGNRDDQSIVCDDDGLRIFPVSGRAVVFSNVLAFGVPDARTIHAGEPVIASRNDNAKNQTNPDKKKSVSGCETSTKSDTFSSNKTKYGLNIWICES